MEIFKVYITTEKQQEQFQKWNKKGGFYNYDEFASEKGINPDFTITPDEAFKLLRENDTIQISEYACYVRPIHITLNEGAEVLRKYQIIKDLENEVLK
jgi:hypothetical protein